MRRLLILLIPIILSSCSAQWHLRRAIAKDPNIIKTLDTKVVIDTVIRYDTTIIVPPKNDTSKTDFNCDSLKNELAKRDSATLYSDSTTKVIIKTVNGKPKVIVQTKEVKIPIRITKTVTITKTVPAKTILVEHKGFFYWSGIVLYSILGIGLIILILKKFVWPL